MPSSLEQHPEVRSVLAQASPWHTLEHHGEVTSALDAALANARGGTPPGAVVVADHQTAGRGRAGRRWEDGPTPEASLLVAALVDPPGVATSLVPLVAGLAVTDAMGALGVAAALKWPNDVLAGAAKCAGILVERHEVDGRDVLVVGIGIDVDWRGTDRGGRAAAWTSLAEVLGRGVDRGWLLAALLRALAARLEEVRGDRAATLDAYRTRCATIGEDVEVELPGERHVAGRAIDVDGEGRLVLDIRFERIAVSVGDVVHLGQAGPSGPTPQG